MADFHKRITFPDLEELDCGWLMQGGWFSQQPNHWMIGSMDVFWFQIKTPTQLVDSSLMSLKDTERSLDSSWVYCLFSPISHHFFSLSACSKQQRYAVHTQFVWHFICLSSPKISWSLDPIQRLTINWVHPSSKRNSTSLNPGKSRIHITPKIFGICN